MRGGCKSKYCLSVGGQIINSKKSRIGLSKTTHYLKYDRSELNTLLFLRSENVARSRQLDRTALFTVTDFQRTFVSCDHYYVNSYFL
jgi:hypothetical protein